MNDKCNHTEEEIQAATKNHKIIESIAEDIYEHFYEVLREKTELKELSNGDRVYVAHNALLLVLTNFLNNTSKTRKALMELAEHTCKVLLEGAALISLEKEI